MRDYQRSKCYSWEELHVHSKSRGITPFDQAQAAVDFIWQSEGLSHPPKVKALAKQAITKEASASRLEVNISPNGVRTTVLLHELAHSMTSNHEGESCSHGPRFVGVFMMLLSKYAGHDLSVLMFTAKSAGVDFDFKGKVI